MTTATSSIRPPIPFVLAHLACFGALWSGVSWTSVWLAIGLYWLRMFAVTGGYHRYFSHRTYKTSRFGQFLLALLAQSTAQKSVLWWASKHRHHHRYRRHRARRPLAGA